MKILLILTIILISGIFSQQTTGLNVVQYDCQSSNSYCYTISEEKANWDTANDSCVQQGGRLIENIFSIRLYRINAFIKANNRGEYWSGYRRVGDTCEFQSTDGETFPDSYRYNWKENHPIDGINCVGIYEEINKFLSLNCSTDHTVVCEIDDVTCKARAQDYEDVCSSVFSSGIPTERSLRNLTLNFNVTTDDIMYFYQNSQDIVITQLRANTQIHIPIFPNTIQIGTNTFQENTILVIHRTSGRSKFETSSLKLGSDIITIYTSDSSTTDLTIVFKPSYSDFNNDDECLYLISSDGNWSHVGVPRKFISDQTIECTIKYKGISSIVIGRRNYGYYVRDDSGITNTIITLDLILLITGFTSLVLLLSSLVIFIVSWKKFFSHDINVIHFNNTLALLLAMLSLPLLIAFPFPIYYCYVVSFVLQFLWTNVFVSSLSIAIVVFYTIWVVSIRHTAKKLYKYLIPIGWGVSLLWAAAWVLYNILTVDPCDLANYSNPCIFSNINLKLEIGWSFLGPMVAILLTNALLLILSLFKIWLALRKQNSQEGELKRIRRVVIGGILLVPALGLPFISLLAIQLYDARDYDTASNDQLSEQKNYIAFISVCIINSPIGIVHFLLITCQIKETILRKYCCCCRRKTFRKIGYSLHLNIARNPPKPNRDTPNDVMLNSVPAIESVDSNGSVESTN